MKLKQSSQVILFALLMSASALSFAGQQGVSFFYGLGVGAAYIDENSVYDVAGAGEFILGFEEDGWAIEYAGFQTIESGTYISSIDYKLKGSNTSLAYRTVESRGGTYYKFKYGNLDADLELSNISTKYSLEGDVYSLAMGFRLEKEKRMEVEYSFFSADSSSDVTSDTHMLTLRYLFGGTPGRTGL